ncbi:sucrose synthase 6 [Perilla frutescens var. hirtella]|uniref:sucrose synthase n=1 Tax=Perilla frutescens var. hirtella TaxID=608512 RepID=A0AAD4JFU9_PERFH|nr:sucrose synthase 6 [Perilla frutescens var. hirtella]KAH6833069.1 sucrose synthase 6 [Perilla frutescens var. hirtella]
MVNSVDYIVNQVRAMEEELLLRIKQQGLNVKPRIQFVVTRLIPDAKGNKFNQEMELIEGTTHSHILRIPFITEKGVLGPWVSRFDIYPYLERYAQASISICTKNYTETSVSLRTN